MGIYHEQKHQGFCFGNIFGCFFRLGWTKIQPIILGGDFNDSFCGKTVNKKKYIYIYIYILGEDSKQTHFWTAKNLFLSLGGKKKLDCCVFPKQYVYRFPHYFGQCFIPFQGDKKQQLDWCILKKICRFSHHTRGLFRISEPSRVTTRIMICFRDDR